MRNVLIFQPYLSNRPTSSSTVERQFRFLKYRKDTIVYALFDSEEKDYAKTLEGSWLQPIIVDDLCSNLYTVLENLQKTLNFSDMYIARTYFTPYTQEDVKEVADFSKHIDKYTYQRNRIPIILSKLGVTVHHMVYDPLEFKYTELIEPNKYYLYSSMNNVEGAAPHNFADLGYYDKGIENYFKTYLFTFGGTSMSEERTAELLNIYNAFKDNHNCKVFIRAGGVDNLVDNKIYESLVEKSMFTYTIPSQNPKYVSFTRMLLALSQGTIPLIHPGNNLDCLYGLLFSQRSDLMPFFDELIMSVDELKDLIADTDTVIEKYKNLIDKWHSTKYYTWLQRNIQ
jgi:hypothetical protein